VKGKLRTFLVGAILSGAGLASVAHGQLTPEVQTGSLIPVKPRAVDPGRAGMIRKDFARCIYGMAKTKATALLDNSDPITVNPAAAKIKDIERDLAMETCLGGAGGPDQLALGMKFSTESLRDLLAEEAYLATNRDAPLLSPAPIALPPIQLKYVSTGDSLMRAQGMVSFTDCVVLKDVTHADALLRTMPGSKDEIAAARALSPALGGCLVQGQSATLSAAGIRAIMAYAMWTRFGRGTAQ
jgi:hypothetical protein